MSIKAIKAPSASMTMPQLAIFIWGAEIVAGLAGDNGPAKSAQEVHRVVAWDVVGETEGTGIVHIAPGCGKEDFQLGREEKLPKVAPLDEFGCWRVHAALHQLAGL